MALIIIIAAVIVLAFLLAYRKPRKPVFAISPEELDRLLGNRVAYYRKLDPAQKERFRKEVAAFLNRVRVTGVGTGVTDEDRALIGASAVIPIFAFPGWQYPNLNEILLYPDHFDEHFDFSKENPEREVLGMVGNGPLQNVMVLSKPSLHDGFRNRPDKQNTAIHEFVHLIDKTDGAIDGVPELLLEKGYVEPWLRLIHQKICSIKNNESDINPYASTNEAEFFAVAAEYFFEDPELLKKNHPRLYELMGKIFRQNGAEK